VSADTDTVESASGDGSDHPERPGAARNGTALATRITVIGTGYPGAVHAACTAETGHEVLDVDVDVDVDADADRIEKLAPLLSRDCLVVGKSTVPVGTASRLTARIAELAPATVEVELAWNPEFLREGHAVHDTLSPDRIVVGVRSAKADAILRHVCEAVGADVVTLADAIGHDVRIGRRFLDAGLGFGGGCLPKDIRAFTARADELGVDHAVSLLREVDRINMQRRRHVVDMARDLTGGTFLGRNVAVLGAAFKPDSDDVRDSPALAVASAVQLEGGQVRLHDPEALDVQRRRAAGWVVRSPGRPATPPAVGSTDEG
jgi:UDP-glucose 6-dehydrogenase